MVRYYLFRILLWWTRRNRRIRFAGLHDVKSQDPYKYGVLDHPKEVEAEWPLPESKLKGRSDNIQIFCASTKGQMVGLEFSRRSDGRALVGLYVNTAKGSFALKNNVQVDLSTEDTFAINGLKIQCINVFKRWRISFNGLLQ